VTQQGVIAGGILQRGFWLYVWEVTPADKAPLYYVGRTGDSSSTNAQSPFNRMGQHLGFAKNSNMLRRHLMQHPPAARDRYPGWLRPTRKPPNLTSSIPMWYCNRAACHSKIVQPSFQGLPKVAHELSKARPCFTSQSGKHDMKKAGRMEVPST